jgi:hypothetical protein
MSEPCSLCLAGDASESFPIFPADSGAIAIRVRGLDVSIDSLTVSP